MKTKSYAAPAADKPLEYYEFDRREPNDTDVEIRIQYSGICHSDIHKVRGDWGEVEYPFVPGHEIIGTVTRVGKKVAGYKPGDVVGVGVMVNSCGTCDACHRGMEQYCENDFIGTYGAVDPADGTITKGGYSDLIVVTEKFVLPIPEKSGYRKSFSPFMRRYIRCIHRCHIGRPGQEGRLQYLGLVVWDIWGLKFAKAMGADVWVITSSPEKADDAKRFGADGIVVSSDEEDMKSAYRKFDLIINTIPKEHDLKPYMDLLNINGTICLVGPINPMPGYHGGDVIGGRKSIAGSGIGGLKETSEMLKFCAKHDVLPDVEEITMEQVNEAWDTMLKKQKSSRYVINVQESFQGIMND